MSYEYRKDGRTDEEFASDIKDRTRIERLAAASLVRNWLRKESPDCYLKDNGCGNDGGVLRAGVTQDADFRLVNFNGRDYLLEMKVSPAPCVTLKEDQVGTFERYGDRDDVWVDWCVNFERPTETHYLMTPATSLTLFRTHGSYGAHTGFGGKPGWRLFQREIDGVKAQYELRTCTKTSSDREYEFNYKGAE